MDEPLEITWRLYARVCNQIASLNLPSDILEGLGFKEGVASETYTLGL